MLSFRPIDYSTDVPEIIELLKTSLSENHTTSNFLWKHYENPFGKSYGLLACDEERIVGVRMFMFWEFRKGDEIIKAMRPVDTITHKEYRGQGIFKKLTLTGLNENEGNYDLIFNTPNQNSFPGNIKMGWKEFNRPFNFYISLVLPSAKRAKDINFVDKTLGTLGLENFKNSCFFTTNPTLEFLNWRYKSHEYSFANYKDGSSWLLLIFRQTKVKGLKTVILVDYIGSKSLLKNALKGLAYKLNVITVFGLNTNCLFILNKSTGTSRVVYRNDKKKVKNVLDFSLGDLEGRL